MDNKKQKITGYIFDEKSNVSFYAEDFLFNFISSHSHLPMNNKPIQPSQDGFLIGKTHQGYDIAIYTGRTKVNSWGSHTIQTGAYLIVENNCIETDMIGFWGIQFIGGTLNNLYDRDIKNMDFTDDGTLIIKPQYEKQEYSFLHNDEIIKITIGSSFRFGAGFDGVKVHDDGVYIQFEFEERKERVEVFKYYNLVKDIMSFMTSRANVGVEKILLLNKRDINGVMWPSSRLFIRNEEQFTDRNFYFNLQFVDLKEKITNLLRIFFNNNDKVPTYMLGFLPKNDKDVLKMSNFKIKEICSALECELTFIDDLTVEEDAKLKNLIQAIKDVIRTHKKSVNQLSVKTYDVINNSMKYWTMSAADKIFLLNERYVEAMRALHPKGILLTQEDINSFVKYRNDITHGRHRIITLQIAETGFALQGLVYCCLLKRIGFSDEEIIAFSKAKKISERFI